MPTDGIALARQLTLETSEATELSVGLDDGAGHAFTVDFPGFENAHDVAILGLRPGAVYDLTVTVTARDGRSQFL